MNNLHNGGAGDSGRNQLAPLSRASVRHPAVETQSSQSPPRPADETPLPLSRWLVMVRQRWLLVAGTTVVVTAGVAAGAALTEPVYRATGAIEIRKQSAEVVPVDALFQFERISDQYLQTEYGTLRSRTLLTRALAEPGLAARVSPDLLPGGSPREAERAITQAQRRLTVDPLAGSRIVRISFESANPQLAADVVNALIDQYVALRQEAGAVALVRLDEQADSVRAQLLGTEEALQQYVSQSGLGAIVLGGNDGITVPQERLRRLQQELTAAEADGYRTSAVSTTGNEPASSAFDSDLLRSLRLRIAEVQGEYARLRPTFTDSLPHMMQLRGELAQLDTLIAAEQKRVGVSMVTQHRVARHRHDLLQEAVNEQQRIMASFAVKLSEYERLNRDVESRKQLYSVLQQKRREAALSTALASMDVAVLDRAAPFGRRVRPNPARDIPFAALTGLLLGLGLAFLRDYSDLSLKTPEQVEDASTAPLLAVIPAMPLRPRHIRASGMRAQKDGDGWHRIDSFGTADNLLADAFRGLRTSVLFDSGGALPRILLVTSSTPDEGKTTVSTNLAISMAMLGRRVLLVDADFRRPSLHRVFGVPRPHGLMEQLEGTRPWQQSVRHEVSPGVDLITAGAHTEGPPDLFSSPALQSWLEEVSAAYDLVIVDAPALYINMPDARILAHAADGVLLVVRSGSTSRDLVRRFVAQTPNLVGLVLNQFDASQLPAYYSNYGETTPQRRSGALRSNSQQSPPHTDIIPPGDEVARQARVHTGVEA
jgi:polysaccharide biosynthesis transport protein